ncbi:MAG TPA: response regulator [Pyrinomonadaceae bacterium]|jgi:CheY-like chemotaxis protein
MPENLSTESAGAGAQGNIERSSVGTVEGASRAFEHADSPVVLVVDDFDDTRHLFRQFLEANGYGTLEATNGREAIETAERERPSLLLMDLNMPVLDGFTATLRIRESERIRHIPVVAMTAYDTAEFRAAARAVGCIEYVVKPVDFHKLLLLLQRLLPAERAKARSEATS